MRARAAFALLAMVLCAGAARASAADRYALIVSGAAGDAEYQRQYADWTSTFTAVLKAKFGLPDDQVIVLADGGGDEAAQKPTRDNVRAAVSALAHRAGRDDLVLIVLIGHGNASDLSPDNAKFNLIGPDLTARDWAELVKPIAGRLVFVDGSSGSAPFLQALSARGRIVITATDTAAQLYETVFPEFFVRAFTANEADGDKDGRISILEAFTYASAQVRNWYQRQGRLQSERALLDDNGDGAGREAKSPGADGAIAQVTFLDAPAAPRKSPDLVERSAQLQAEIDRLKARRPEMSDADYQAQMEQLLVELARVSAQIRGR